MKIYVTYNKDDHRVLSVYSLEYYIKNYKKTEQEVEEALNTQNEKCGYERFKSFTIDGELGEVFRFLLGDGEYLSHKNITHVYNILKDIRADIEEIQSDCYQACSFLEDKINEIEPAVPENERCD